MRSTSVGIVGVGRVGHRVAELLSSLEHLPLGFDPYVSDQELRDRGVEPVASLHELLERCSVLTLHVPLTDETRGMIGREELEMLQEPRIVINTSRGEVLDPALIDWAVREGIVSGAWLDVFPEEPYEETGWSGSNLLLSPHAAGCSREARRKASHTMYEGLCQALDLEPAR